MEEAFEGIEPLYERYVYAVKSFTSTFAVGDETHSAQEVDAGPRQSVDRAIVFLAERFTDLQLWW